MTIRESLELREKEYLSPYASLSMESEGRDRPESECDIRTIYQRDRDRILHSKAFRRLKQKTQVFLRPVGDHYRTRLTHTLEVSQNARTIGKALRLNEDLVEAIALGHDLGHTPFGHAGEAALNTVCPGGFLHNEQSLRVVEYLEKNCRGLNLTKEVRDGILNHPTRCMPSTLEGKIVRLSDKIAYIHHDIDDAIRGQIMCEEDIPFDLRKVLGFSSVERLDTMIHDIIINSEGKSDIVMSLKVEKAMIELRQFMFEKVYTNPVAKGEESKAKSLLLALFEYYMSHLELLPKDYQKLFESGKFSEDRVVCDYIAGMTDKYAMEKYAEFFFPIAWKL